jgi:exonuclease III
MWWNSGGKSTIDLHARELLLVSSSGYGGVAIISKLPGTLLSTGVGDATCDTESRVLTVALPSLIVCAVYSPSTGWNADGTLTRLPRKDYFFRHLESHLKALTQPYVVLGDFNNISSDDDHNLPVRSGTSTHPTHPSCSETELQTFSNFTNSLGLVDTFSSKAHMGPRATWVTSHPYRCPDTTFDWIGVNVSLRIDYIFMGPSLAPSATILHHEHVDFTGLTDHHAVLTVLRLPPDEPPTQLIEQLLHVDELCALVPLTQTAQFPITHNGFPTATSATHDIISACLLPHTRRSQLHDEIFLQNLCDNAIMDPILSTHEDTQQLNPPVPQVLHFPAATCTNYSSCTLPMSSVRILEERFTAMYDSGSTKNLMSAHAAATLLHSSPRATTYFHGCPADKRISFVTATGDHSTPDRMLLQVPVFLRDDLSLLADFYIVPNCPFSVILGSSFMLTHGINLVASDQAWRVEKAATGSAPQVNIPILPSTPIYAASPFTLSSEAQIIIKPHTMRDIVVTVNGLHVNDSSTATGMVDPSTNLPSLIGLTSLSTLRHAERPGTPAQIIMTFHNTSDKDVTVARGAEMGTFTSLDLSEYTEYTMGDGANSSDDSGTHLGESPTCDTAAAASITQEKSAVPAFDYETLLALGKTLTWNSLVAKYPHLGSVPFHLTKATGDSLAVLLGIIATHESIFREPTYEEASSGSDNVQAHIQLKPHMLGRSHPFQRRSQADDEEIDKQTAHQLQLGIIRRSTSPISTNVILVKKSDGTKRFAIDYRELNKATVNISYPITDITHALGLLGQCSYFTLLDCAAAYWQIVLHEASRKFTAFVTRRGLFEYIRMPFGLKNAPAIWCAHIDNIMADFRYKFLITYFDDLMCYTKTSQVEHSSPEVAHLYHIFATLARLKLANLFLKGSKAHFMVHEVVFLGSLVTRSGILPDPSKTQAITSITESLAFKSTSTLKSVLALFSYRRNFIKDFASIAAPLHTLLSNSRLPFPIPSEAIVAFQSLKNKLINATMLAHADFDKPFVLQVDASNLGLGACLMNVETDSSRATAHILSYASRALKATEHNYTQPKLETLAVVWALKKYEYLLRSSPYTFTVETDHEALVSFLGRSGDQPVMIIQWQLYLQEFSNLQIAHRGSAGMRHVDCLSRVLPASPPHDRFPVSTLPFKRDSSFEAPLIANDMNLCAFILDSDTLACPLVDNAPQDELGGDMNVPQNSDAIIFINSPDALRKLSASKFREFQNKDPSCARILNRKADKEPPSALPQELQDNHVGKYFINHSQLLVQVARSSRDTIIVVVVVPLDLTPLLLCHVHSQSHVGRDKMRQLFRDRYIWHRMTQDIDEYCQSCISCRMRKDYRPMNQGPTQSISASGPFDKILFDMVPIARDVDGYCWILTFICVFSRYVIFRACKDKAAATIALKVYEVFMVHGTCEILFGDKAKELQGTVMKQLTKLFNVTLRSSTGDQPQSNAICERSHSSLMAYLTLCTKDVKNAQLWRQYLSAIEFSMNITVHSSTGFSPFEIVYGRKPLTTIDVIYDNVNNAPTSGISGNDAEWSYAQLLHDRLRDTYKACYEAQQNKALITRQRLDSKKSQNIFALHQRVIFFKVPHGPEGAKLNYRFSTPHRIVALDGPLHYWLLDEDDALSEPVKTHVNKIRAINMKYKHLDWVNKRVDKADLAPLLEYQSPVALLPGMFFAYPIVPVPGLRPWYIGKLLKITNQSHPDFPALGKALHFQYLDRCDTTLRIAPDNPLGPYFPSWYNAKIKDKKKAIANRVHKFRCDKNFTAFTNFDHNEELYESQVHIWGFDIDETTGALPLAVLRTMGTMEEFHWEYE